MGNLSLQRSPWKFFNLQMGPSDSCLLSSSSVSLASSLLCFCFRRSPPATPRAPPPAEFSSTRRSTALPPLLILCASLPTECHEVLAVLAPPKRRPPSVRRPAAWKKCQRPRALSCRRISTTRISSTHSYHQLVISPPLDLGTLSPFLL
jgi:hypothetical protein